MLKQHIVVLGHGFVGSVVAELFSWIGKHGVTAYDPDPASRKHLADHSHVNLIHNPDLIESADAYIICVPTGLDTFSRPDLSHVVAASQMIHTLIKRRTVSDKPLVVLESTSHPGTLHNIVMKYVGQDLAGFAVSPERINPPITDRNTLLAVAETPKLFGVYGTQHSTYTQFSTLYGSVFSKLMHGGVLEVEAAKMLENAYRLVNIAFINEMATAFRALGADPKNVIELAATKPYGFQKFLPGPGAGGHCIPVDPMYLKSAANIVGVQTPLLDKALEQNTYRPESIANAVYRYMHKHSHKKVCVFGVGYKPGLDDIRESPGAEIARFLKRNPDIKVTWSDPWVSDLPGVPRHEPSALADCVLLDLLVEVEKWNNRPPHSVRVAFNSLYGSVNLYDLLKSV